MDNRNKVKSAALEEIENDDSPIDEGENPKDDEAAAGHIDDPENKETPEEKVVEKEEEELILADDEEIDEETGEVKKKEVAPLPPVKQKLPEEEERYREQRTESIIVNEKNKQLTDAFIRANQIPEPTEDILKQSARSEGFDWEEMDNFQKSQFKKSFVNDQKLAILNEVGTKVSNIDEWAKSVDKYLDENETNQTNKDLIGKEGAFRSYAMKQSHRGADMSLLISGFLHDLPQQKRNNQGSLMLTRTGGERVEKKSNLQDAEYIAGIRKSNPKEYARLLRSGKINIEP